MLAARLIKQRKYSCTYVVLSTLHKIALRALVGRIKYLVSSNTFPYLFQKYLPQKNIQNEQERCYTVHVTNKKDNAYLQSDVPRQSAKYLAYEIVYGIILPQVYTLSWPCFFVLLWISGRLNTRYHIYLNCISIEIVYKTDFYCYNAYIENGAN